MDKVWFIATQYALLATFVISCFGIGIWSIRGIGTRNLPVAFNGALSLCIGMGVIIVMVQYLGIAGWLRPIGVVSVLVPGWIGFILHCTNLKRNQLNKASRSNSIVEKNFSEKWKSYAVVLVFASLVVGLFLRPLSPPVAWDEVMYHLPHAREWASAGRLTINEWLRYPLFPYNFNLLYAGGLLFGTDTFAHLAHAFAAVLVISGIYGLSQNYFGRAVACIAAVLFASATKWEISTAYIDLGLTAFLFFSATCTFLWWERRNFQLLCFAVFLFGVAAGIKYQALVFAPFFAAVIIFRERQASRLLILLFLFSLPCAYWYIRNVVVSGDPFNPLGGAIFGYWSWNAQDVEYQLADIRRVYGWPNWEVWPAVGALALWFHRKEAAFRSLIMFGVFATATWMLTSHYPRYLLPAYPFLCILAALVVNDIFQFGTVALHNRWAGRLRKRIDQAGRTSLTVLLIILLLASTASATKQWKNIFPTDEQRATYLRKNIKAFEAGEFLHAHPEYRIVQLGLESDLYYLPPQTIGDVFGPGRYGDFINLSPADLKEKVRSVGANALLLSTTGEAAKLSIRPKFNEHFSLVFDSPGAQLYLLN